MTVWLFDLDNTLHNASRHAFPVIDRLMTEWIAGTLAVDTTQADWLRRHYWQRYGATMLGLKRHHPHVDLDQFLHATHPISRLTAELYPLGALNRVLTQLRGHKVLFTNGPTHYGEAMLGALGVRRHFDLVLGVDRVGYTPKPFASAYRALLREVGVNARDCILVEDSIANLVTARRLGMRTVWLRRHTRQHPAADVTIRRFDELAERFTR
ncbi:pyrimidine 5'-nucleotidase [Chitinibacteraceae bacterium HSL-7]